MDRCFYNARACDHGVPEYLWKLVGSIGQMCQGKSLNDRVITTLAFVTEEYELITSRWMCRKGTASFMATCAHLSGQRKRKP